MAAAKLLYLDDCYVKECDAVVTNASETDKWVELDQTCFYPTGGGQDHDTGWMEFAGGKKLRVRDVQKKGPILHYLEIGEGQAVPKIGEKVHCVVDFERRYAHMKMHIAQHLVSATVLKMFGCYTVGNQIHADKSHIDFFPAKFSNEDLLKIENESNAQIKAERGVKISYISREEAIRTTDPKRTDISRLPASVDRIRIIEIEGYDSCPCGGTHVSNLRELGRVKILKTDNKGKDKARLTYELV